MVVLQLFEVTDCSYSLITMLLAFEQIKHIYQYRTPITLHAFSDFFIKIMPVLFALVLVSLANIQEHLENPFDQIGQDDVFINSEKFVDRLLAGAPQ